MAKPVTRSQTREQPEIQDLEEEQPSRPSLIPVAPNMQSFMSTASTSRSNEPTSRTNEKAPTIRASDLPNFDGKVLNWLPFKLVFSRVVLNEPSISDAQKLGLLIKVTSGRALNRVVALTQRELSTAEIFNSLEDYFHSNTKVEECLSQMVRKLPFVSNYYDLAQFEEMLWQFRDLESICSGLGPEYEAREEMEEKMTQLYESAMRLTEADDSQRHRSSPSRNARPPSSSYRGRSNHSRSVVAAVTASPQCQLCPRSGHASAECNATLSHDEKKRLFSEKSLCFKCAETGHRSNVCPNRNSVRCSSCQLSHPSVLHGVRFNSSRPNQQSQSPAHSSSSNNVVGAVLPLVSSVDQIVAPIQPLSSASDVCHARYIGVAPLSITIDRPAFSLSLNNRKIVAWLDTCSPYTMIRKALVDPNQTFPCRGIRSCGYSGGPISSSATKINIMIEGPNFATNIEAYVMEVLPFCDMLIGTDMLPRLSKWDQSRRLRFETGFGDIHFGPVCAVQPMEQSEDADEDMLDMNVIRLDNGTFEASLPFLSDVRPASNYDHVLRLTSALINRLIRNGTYDQYREEFFQYVSSEEEIVNILGSVWTTTEDVLSLKPTNLESPRLTKRTMLSTIGKVFDPLGLLEPLKLSLRLIFSRIVHLDWDIETSTDIANEWNHLIDHWPDTQRVSIPRHISNVAILYCFADASEVAFGLCCFLGESFLIGKSKIATQDKTIVEKELIALCELIRMVQKILGILHNCDIHPEVKIFSDSKINVDRLNMSPNKHKLFVARKVMNILRFVNSNGASVYHIPGTHNPADRFSRPANPSNYLITKPWILDLSILPIEPSPITVVCAVTTNGDSSDPDILEFLGRLPSSRRMVAWVQKWLSWIPAYRTVPSLDRAFIVLYRLFQLYYDYKDKTKANYMNLSEGWKFLTTAENLSTSNGYFGATFWNPEREKIVIAHRGTSPTNFGAVLTDIQSIYGDKISPQMSSAVTFTHNVQRIFAEIDKECGTHFKMFITGHSLGAWLAQICTFSVKYLTIMDDDKTYFVKSEEEGHHAHTVVFDSPGCKPMLQQLQREFDVRYDSVEKLPIDCLDITSYLSAPNLINTCNPHVGKIYRVFINFSNKSFFDFTNKFYILQTHSLENILETFDKETGLFKKENVYYVYKDKTKASYINLPNGWKFLTTAENLSTSNGYFGATFWNPEREQVVIAHRGTELTNIGAVWTDIQSIYGNKVASQISSAITFSHYVQRIFAEIDNEYGTHFKMFITGHSLGGWLAQICTFSVKYLTIMDDDKTYFVKSKEDGHHAHTVVFDSPGCKPMLQQLQREFDVRYDNVEKLPIDCLDITSYLSAPNLINTCNPHVGKIYRVFIDFSNKSFFNEYNLQTHEIKNILEAFDKKIGLFKKENDKFNIKEVVDWPETSILNKDEYKEFFEWADKLNNYHPTYKVVKFKDYYKIKNILETFDKKIGLFKKENGIFKIQEVVDWPETSVLKRDEYNKFFEWAKELNNYHPTYKDVKFNDYHLIRYQTKEFNEKQCSLNVFSQLEQQFLKQYQSVRLFSGFYNLNKLFDEEHLKLLDKLSIDESNHSVKIQNGSIVELYNTISYIRQLLIKYPGKNEKLETWLSNESIVENIYKNVSISYLDINKHWLKFEICENIERKLVEFLTNQNQIVWKIDVTSGDTFCTLKQIYTTFLKKIKNESICKYTEKHCIVLDLKNLLQINRYIKALNFVKSTKNHNRLLIIEYNPNQADNNDDYIKTFFANLFDELKSSNTCKIILCAKDNYILKNILSLNLDTQQYIETKDEGFTWNDLDIKSQTVLLKRKIVFQEKKINLEELIDELNIKDQIDQLIDYDTLVKLINDDNKIEIGNKTFGIENLEGAYADLYKEVNNETLKLNLIKNSIKAVYFISGLFESNDEHIALKELADILNFEKIPEVDIKDYELEIDGLTLKEPIQLTLDQIKTLIPKHSVTSVVQCARNRRDQLNTIKEVKGISWGVGAIGNAQWTGAKLVDILQYCGVDMNDPSIKHVQFEGLDLDATSTPYGASVPSNMALNPMNEFKSAYEMNGEPISADHGFPIRLIAPGVVGARNVKWLGRIVLSDEESYSHWQRNDYKSFPSNMDSSTKDEFARAHSIQQLPIQSAICTPKDGQPIAVQWKHHPQSGTTKPFIELVGYAKSGGGRAVIRVDLTTDNGRTWHMATLEQEPNKPVHHTYSWTL
ncbi:hypothetical protein RDWZM_009849 [Blomia tropicalis]|uniref:CCHC-type domain-containing protein n=1 Tax=Blomia tropicalis TaxID=40697 RepID=A0A9Q0RI35_BLOTA|nr:hypothetical protein RDWZM_009849 [Blomia tropicalis]